MIVIQTAIAILFVVLATQRVYRIYKANKIEKELQTVCESFNVWSLRNMSMNTDHEDRETFKNFENEHLRDGVVINWVWMEGPVLMLPYNPFFYKKDMVKSLLPTKDYIRTHWVSAALYVFCFLGVISSPLWLVGVGLMCFWKLYSLI